MISEELEELLEESVEKQLIFAIQELAKENRLLRTALVDSLKRIEDAMDENTRKISSDLYDIECKMGKIGV